MAKKALFALPNRGFLDPPAGQYWGRRRDQLEQAHLRAGFATSAPQTGAWRNDARGVIVQRGTPLVESAHPRARPVMHEFMIMRHPDSDHRSRAGTGTAVPVPYPRTGAGPFDDSSMHALTI